MIKFRTWDPQYIAAVDKWWGALLAAASPYAYNTHGGPIVIVQIENEYNQSQPMTAPLPLFWFF